MSVVASNATRTGPRSALNKGVTAICGMPGMRSAPLRLVALTYWTGPITMSFLLAFVERRK
eukprot:7622252-Prorocentrum_lima.AAC.1